MDISCHRVALITGILSEDIFKSEGLAVDQTFRVVNDFGANGIVLLCYPRGNKLKLDPQITIQFAEQGLSTVFLLTNRVALRGMCLTQAKF